MTVLFFLVSGSFYFLSGRACSLLASAVAFRFRPAGGRLWDCDGFASLLGKAGRGIACSVLCINKRLERRCFDVHPFTSGFLKVATICVTSRATLNGRMAFVWELAS